MRSFRISNPSAGLGTGFGFRIWPRAIFTLAFAIGLLAAPVPSHGQQPAKVYRIGWLGVTTGGYETNPQHCPIKGRLSWQEDALTAHSYSHCLSSGIPRAILT